MSKSPPAPVRLTLPRPSRDGRAAPGDQLAAQLRYRILVGDLRPGDRLPPVRRLAARPRPAGLRVGFVECNTVDLTYFRRLLEREVGAPIRPILLRRLPVAARGCDLLVTAFFHIEEVQRRVPSREVLGLVALPDFRTLEEVAKLSRTARVALVCATDEGGRSKARSLRAVGLRRPRLGAATLGARHRLRAALGRAGGLLASLNVLERLRGTI